ncbi:Rha family transcriptional regulator [Salmonella enterica subsp. enterica serovar Oranienburg]|nr:Rha family transcriptional regulator [Salmonella enterica subsp. enterica serovar Oranienburg]
MNNQSVIPAFDFREMVQAKNGEVVTTSRKIAKYFGKRHGDVLRKIEQVKADCSSEFSQRNFASADYIDEQGKLRPMYSLTKDGWIMVVMGFTGKAAAAIKESYIAAFNWMSDQLSRRLAMGEEMQHRYAIKETRSKLKATIRDKLISYQEECFAVLHDYWTKGIVVNPRRLSVMEELNQACADMKRDKGIASLFGTGLNEWKSVKAAHVSKIRSLVNEANMLIEFVLADTGKGKITKT